LTDTEADSAVITLRETESCADFPELTLDASGTVTPRQWEDGSVYGIVEMHSHMLTNFGFGGGGVFHGGPFHRLGVQHALGSCEQFHGEGGRRDLMGSFYNGAIEFDVAALLPIVTSGQLDEHQHETDGYPEFTDWPNAWGSSTHQVMYYRWMERAYLSGMRLVIQHATGNSVLCDFMTGIGAQGARYSCNDMVSVDRSIAEIRNMERYIDAQSGGPGLGWFRVVESTEEAREVINAGKMAVVLGIEISNLFDCFLTPQVGFDICDADSVRADLDRYYDLGVRVVFPVHKYDNAFSPGDGWGGVTELGNVINSGHYTNMVEECPPSLSGQDSGNLTFGGLNRPRDDYFAPAPLDMSGFAEQPLATLLPIASDITEGGAPGNFCQNTGMTDLGETLLTEMMMRGMIPDIAHLPRQSVVRSLEMLRENDYPATSTHRATYDGAIYEIGGMSAGGIASCGRPDSPGSMSRSVLDRANQRGEAGYYPSEGISFDFNGFAGSRRPRFGENSGCSQPQENPVEYPFTSYDGDIEFTEPQLGDRSVDFNTEGMIHIGMLPELIEDARQDGATDEELEPLFRSAEAYLQMWERAETRGLELRDE
jgi:microsomal dipeptidase-like Zn-dependent dipeptidase